MHIKRMLAGAVEPSKRAQKARGLGAAEAGRKLPTGFFAPVHLVLVLLILPLLSACTVVVDPGARVGAAAENFVAQARTNPSSCARDFRVLEPNLTRSPQQMDLNAGYYQGVLNNTGEHSFVVRGTFPHSILLSWVIYDADGQIYSAVYDQQMTPDDGNVNPFLQAGGRADA
jgi:hypothetical protein